jgi:hypothetical protein
MKKSLFTLLAMLMFGSVFAQTHYPNHWHMNGSLHPNSSTIFAVLYVDDVLFEGDYYEIDAYNVTEDEVSGGQPAHFGDGWLHDYPYFDLIYNGEPGDIIVFSLYDHRTETMTDFVTSETRVYADGIIEGGPDTPFEFRFYSEGQDFAFNGDGAWSNLEFWTVNGEAATRLPNSLDNVTIESGICYMTEEAQFATLTIEDGAEFYPVEGAEVTAIVKKNIDAYQVDNNWYLLSFPTDLDNPDFVGAGMITNSAYDLFFFDQNFPGEVVDETSENGEWRNYKYYIQNGLNFIAPIINNGHSSNGYLYANKQNTTLHFTGNLYTESNLVYQRVTFNNTTADQVGVNLIGNPYTCKAVVDLGSRMDQDNIYKMNEERNDVIVYDISEFEYTYVDPMTAFFAIATANNNSAKITLTPLNVEEYDGIEPGIVRSNVSTMSIELTANGILKDRVYVKAGEGENCPKFNLNENSTKIFVPQNNKNYAIAYTEGANVMPLCFTTKENGIYTLNFNTKNMNCSYLHLIDNVTGADIDMLQTPSYTFNSSDSNYATRFKLVFNETATNEIADSFAFISNGELMINNNGNATLQVIDITGRILSSENIQNCYSKSLNLSAGVYVVRLTNGNDVKTQKIVVE